MPINFVEENQEQSSAPAPEPSSNIRFLGESVPTYIEEDNSTISAPSDMPADQVQYLNGTQNKNQSPSSFLGYTKAVGGAALNIPKVLLT